MQKKLEELYNKIDKDNLPVHIGIIMDGNGRWAKKRGLPRSAGHNEGSKTFEKIAKFASEIGIKVLTVFAFSTENWKRPQDEVNEIMRLLRKFLNEAYDELSKKNIKLKIIGDIHRLDKDIQEQILNLENKTKDNKKMLLNIAVNYGGRQDILHAVNNIVKEAKDGVSDNEITEEIFEKHLYTEDAPNPDLIIRSSGETRISNFLIWQMAYSEFWFDNILWPDFEEKDFLRAIIDYQQRNRRFGGI